MGTALGLSLFWFIPGNPGCSCSPCGAEGWEFPALSPSSQGSPQSCSQDFSPLLGCVSCVNIPGEEFSHLGRFPDGCTAGILSEGHWAEPVDPEGLRSVFYIHVFSTKACFSHWVVLHGHRECLWAQFVSRVGHRVPLLSCGSGKFLFQSGLIQQSLPSAFPLFLRARPSVRGRFWSLGVSTDPWMVSMQQLQLIPVAWECWGELEKGVGSAWWESHPAAPGGLGLPSHHFFFFFPEFFL